MVRNPKVITRGNIMYLLPSVQKKKKSPFFPIVESLSTFIPFL